MDQHVAGARIGLDAFHALFAAEHQFQRGRKARASFQRFEAPAFPSGGPGAERHSHRPIILP